MSQLLNSSTVALFTENKVNNCSKFWVMLNGDLAYYPANQIRGVYVRLRRWPNFKTTLGQLLSYLLGTCWYIDESFRLKWGTGDDECSSPDFTHFLSLMSHVMGWNWSWWIHFNPWSTKWNSAIFHPLEIVSRYRDPQLQVGENYWYVFSLRPNSHKPWCLNTHFIPDNSDFNVLIKRIKTGVHGGFRVQQYSLVVT